MAKKSISKKKVVGEIEEFFSDIGNKSPKEIKKIKILASSKNIPLKEKRKLFCKKCLNPYGNSKIRTKNLVKSITCDNCNFISRWKL